MSVPPVESIAAPAASPPATTSGVRRRILHVLPDLERGGGQQVLLRSLRYMDPERYAHHVVYFALPEELLEPFRAAADEVTLVPCRGLRDARASVAAVRRIVRQREIDIVHVNGTPVDKLHGTLAAWYERKPLLWTLHGMCPTSDHWWHTRRRPHPRRLWRSMLRAGREASERYLDRRTVGRVLAVSDAVLESWQPYLERVGIPPERVSVSYNGVPLEDYDTEASRRAAEALRRELDLADAWPILLMIGRLNEGKGQHHLAHAMRDVCAKHPGARLLLVGDGSAAHRQWLRDALDAAGTADCVRWLGTREDIPDLLALCDLYVFASATEGFPLSVLEALAAGRPVAAYHLPALERVVRAGENGTLVPAERAALAAAICDLASDRDALRAAGRRSREIVADGYSMQAATVRLMNAYDQLVAEHADA